MSHKEIKNWMIERGIKNSFVAEKIGVTPGHFRKFLSGKANLGESAQLLLSQFLVSNESDKAAS